MPQILRFILLVAVIAAVVIGIYYWVEDDEGVEEIEQLDGGVEELEEP
ncbi:MAG: hypothetical protein ACLFWF_04670 [Alphaproteobacteria bacterium]